MIREGWFRMEIGQRMYLRQHWRWEVLLETLLEHDLVLVGQREVEVFLLLNFFHNKNMLAWKAH